MRVPNSNSHVRQSLAVVLLSFMLFPMVGCGLVGGDSDSGLFGDSDSDGFQINLAGVYDVTYNLDEILTTCNLPPTTFTVPATATTQNDNMGLQLSFQFSDAPAAIIGYYDESDQDYEGSTGPVHIEGDEYADEKWSVRYDFSDDRIRFNGFSIVDFGTLDKELNEVDPQCQRYFNITGINRR